MISNLPENFSECRAATAQVLCVPSARVVRNVRAGVRHAGIAKQLSQTDASFGGGDAQKGLCATWELGHVGAQHMHGTGQGAFLAPTWPELSAG